MERIDLFIKTIKPEKTNKNKNPLRIISDGEPKWSYAHNYPIKFGDSTKILNTAIFDGEKTQNNIVGIIEYRDNKLDDEQKVLQLQTNMKVCSQCKFGGIIYDGGKNKYYEIHSEGNGLGFTQSNAAEMVINDWLKNVITEK
ncbi:hypothetical protein FACS1894166_12800 [Bacilli bacterium]|nr:hypothetical protein FACS1894166_12800 [Bacilli bacterium]